MKIHSYTAALAALCLASCTVSELTNGTGIIPEIPGGEIKTVISASIDYTKTTLGTPDANIYPVLWQTGDKICVNGAESNALTAADIDGQDATFSFTSEVTAPYKAVYPASAVTSFAAGQATITLPRTQEYVSGSFDPAAAVLVGTGSGPVSLTSAMAFLKVRTSGSAKIARLEVASLGSEKMAGAFKTSDFITIAADSDGDSFTGVAVVPASPVDAGAEIIVAIPAQSYADGFKITMVTPEGNGMQTLSEKAFNPVAGHMYAFSLAFNPSNDLVRVCAPVDDVTVKTGSLDGDFLWNDNDAIAVWTGSKMTQFNLDSDNLFTGALAAGEAVNSDSFAFYPYSSAISFSGSVANLNNVVGGVYGLPTEQVYMYATKVTPTESGVASEFEFHHFTAYIRVTLKNIPFSAKAFFLECYCPNKDAAIPNHKYLFTGGTVDAKTGAFSPASVDWAFMPIPEHSSIINSLTITIPVIPGNWGNDAKLRIHACTNTGFGNEINGCNSQNYFTFNAEAGDVFVLPDITFPAIDEKIPNDEGSGVNDGIEDPVVNIGAWN